MAAQELGWSHRRLIDRFRVSVGMPPKMLACILCFDRVAARLQAVTEPRLAEVALVCGYLARRLPGGGGVTG
jgi:hypothetical protein